MKNERPKCGCGNTNDPDGYCDGSHANIVKEEVTEITVGEKKVKVSLNSQDRHKIEGWHNLDVEVELKDVLEEDLKNTLKEEVKKNKK